MEMEKEKLVNNNSVNHCFFLTYMFQGTILTSFQVVYFDLAGKLGSPDAFESKL